MVVFPQHEDTLMAKPKPPRTTPFTVRELIVALSRMASSERVYFDSGLCPEPVLSIDRATSPAGMDRGAQEQGGVVMSDKFIGRMTAREVVAKFGGEPHAIHSAAWWDKPARPVRRLPGGLLVRCDARGRDHARARGGAQERARGATVVTIYRVTLFLKILRSPAPARCTAPSRSRAALIARASAWSRSSARSRR